MDQALTTTSGGAAAGSGDPLPSISGRTRDVLGIPEPVERSTVRATLDQALDRVGGPLGLATAVAPTIAFVAADSVAGLAPGVIALAVTALVACGVRLARRESPGAAVAGLVVAALCAAAAALVGEARAFFLPTMVLPVLFVTAYAVSLTVQRPLMGLIVGPLSGGPRGWREHRALHRLYTVSTVVGMGLAGVNLTVRIVFYIADQPAALAVVQIAATSAFAAHFAVTLVLARRAAGVLVPATVHAGRP
jgi:hypothetical protein